MSLAVVPLVITGQITGVSGDGNATLYRMTFKNIDGDPLYGVTSVWTDEQAEIEALAAQKPYGVWINPIDGTFTVKFAGYTYTGTADLTDPLVLAGITLIKFNNEAGGGGSNDFSTCQLTLINNSENQYALAVAQADIDNNTSGATVTSSGFQSENVATVILYKGMAGASFEEGNMPPDSAISVSGDIEYDAESDYFRITGDGTITIKD